MHGKPIGGSCRSDNLLLDVFELLYDEFSQEKTVLMVKSAQNSNKYIYKQ